MEDNLGDEITKIQRIRRDKVKEALKIK
jgi:hypothetical protein